MRALEVESTELFVGSQEQPRQVLRVVIDGFDGPAAILVSGVGVAGSATATSAVTEVALSVDSGFGSAKAASRRPVGSTVPIRVVARDAAGSVTVDTEFVVAEPGWTMHLISHFHYDPVWWATQAAYTATWNDEAPDSLARAHQMKWQQPGFLLIDIHLDLARRDPDYKFVLAEVDLLKPYWDARPEQRSYFRQLLAEGRLELMGGTYNEPNSNLTSAEVTIRNFVYGLGFQHDVFGAEPDTAWQLDVFGHDPQFPGIAADAGITTSSWARGPFRPWGPMLKAYLPLPGESWGDPSSMQFHSEFEWISPSGKGVLTHYMPAHYSAGWITDDAASLGEAEAGLYELFCQLKKVAATRNVLLPVGTDYTPPNKWITDVHRDWNARYVWPRFVCAVPAEFFAAVRAELTASGRQPSAQTRDMNPIFTGKEVSFIDTKQAHRAAETLLADAEKFAVFARAYGAGYPHAALDKAWRHLIYGAHHDAVTGSESDQVYLDLMTNWHEALELANSVLDSATEHLTGLIAGHGWAVTVFNPSSWRRSEITEVQLQLPEGGFTGLALVDGDSGAAVSMVVTVHRRHPDASIAEATATFLAADVPGLGYRSWQLVQHAAESGTWTDLPGTEGELAISSARYRVRLDPAHGGCVASMLDLRTDRELLTPGKFGNALLRTLEYAEHPTFNEGPWHLLPKPDTLSSAQAPALSVRVQSSPLGERAIIDGVLDGTTYRQVVTLYAGLDRLDCSTELHDFTGADQLFRVQWPAGIAGAMPVSEVANAVIGRGHALIDVDSADHPWTLDNPAYGFFALSCTAKIRIATGAGTHVRAINTAEIIGVQEGGRELAVALVRVGVTATTSAAASPRYGNLAVDSNLPDVRISVGTVADNPFTASVLATSPEHAAEFATQLADTGSARVWVPASAPLAQVWQPSADLRAVRVLPVLLVAGPDAVHQLCADLSDAILEVAQSASAADGSESLDEATVAVLNRGLPGFAVDTDGALHLSLMRSCTGWPSGVWIDPPARTAPDGSAFELQHWSHTFEYAVASGAGDWRESNLVPLAHDFNHPMSARAHQLTGSELPAQLSFLDIDADGDVVVTAVKAASNPLANGTSLPADDMISIRLYEASGRPATVRLRGSQMMSDGQRLNMIEQDGEPIAITDGVLQCQLAPAEIATLGARLGSGDKASAVEFIEPAQPVFARYWLHNTGTAPAGNLPVAAHFRQHVISADGPFSVSGTVASSLADADTEGTLTLNIPTGWTAEPATAEYALGAGRYRDFDFTVSPSADAEPGCYLVGASISEGGQTVQDLCRVLVGTSEIETVQADMLSDSLLLAVGESGRLRVRLASDAMSDVPVQVQLITSWDLWAMTPDWNTGAVIPARGSVDVDFTVGTGNTAKPGRWWALVKVSAVGRVMFTKAVNVEIAAK